MLFIHLIFAREAVQRAGGKSGQAGSHRAEVCCGEGERGKTRSNSQQRVGTRTHPHCQGAVRSHTGVLLFSHIYSM
jgi:hypothetical protein